MRLPPKYLIGDFLRKTAGILTVIAISVATLGIPLPHPVAKQVSEWFPCMHCGCGCTNAETCWRQCCCFSDVEKVAWAARHGVEVPDYVLDRLVPETRSTYDANLAKMKPCCRRRAIAARAAAECHDSNACTPKTEAEPVVVPGVLALHALKCQGSSLALSLLPPSVPADEIGTELPLLPCEEANLVQEILYQPPSFDAVVPPPESAAFSPLT